MDKIKIMIADDHKMFRDGLKEILNKEDNIQVVDEANDGAEVLEKLERQPVDVVLMDIDMGGFNGIETTKSILSSKIDTRVLVLSMHADSKYIISMLEAGAKGYILKNAGKEEMIAAINTVAMGNSYFSSQVSSRITEQLRKVRSQRSFRARNQDIPITPRE